MLSDSEAAVKVYRSKFLKLVKHLTIKSVSGATANGIGYRKHICKTNQDQANWVS